MPTRTKALLRLASLLCAIVLATTIAACGDNDDNSNGDGGGANASQDGGTQTADGSSAADDAAGGSDEDQIKALIATSQEAFKTGDGQTICGNLTAAGQKDIVKYGGVIGIAGDCAEVAKGIADYNKKVKLKQPPSEIVAVRVDGKTATAVMRVEGTGQIRQGFNKIDGQWKQLPYGLATLAGAPQ